MNSAGTTRMASWRGMRPQQGRLFYQTSERDNEGPGYSGHGDLIRLIVTRSECDLQDIKEQYLKLFGKSLEKDIEGDCSGPYKNALIALFRGN